LKVLNTEKKVLVFGLISSILFYQSFYFTGSLVIAVCVFLVFGSLDGIFSPIIITYTQNHIASDIRATSGSVQSIFGSLEMIIGLHIGGFI